MTPNSSEQLIQIYKPLGTKQCEQDDPQQNLTQIRQQLLTDHIQVHSAHIAQDGQMRIALCGAADGKIAVFEISDIQLQRSKALGFEEFSQLKSNL